MARLGPGNRRRDQKAQFRLIEAPSRASAARSSSSSTEDKVSATSATDFASGAREAADRSAGHGLVVNAAFEDVDGCREARGVNADGCGFHGIEGWTVHKFDWRAPLRRGRDYRFGPDEAGPSMETYARPLSSGFSRIPTIGQNVFRRFRSCRIPRRC